MDDANLEPHHNVYLSSNFVGSRMWRSNNVSNGLCLARGVGQPTFFIMMTCNLKWPELCSNTILQSDWNITVLDIPLIAICIFKFCLSHLFQDLNTLFGSMKYCVHVIRFQKRGLPHAHITIKFSDTYIHPHEIDLAISAQLPVDCNNLLLVKQFMIHKHKGPGGYPSNTNGCHLKEMVHVVMNFQNP